MNNYLKLYHSRYLLAKRINEMYKTRRKKLLCGIHVRGCWWGRAACDLSRYPACASGLFTGLLLPQILMTAECRSGLGTEGTESYWNRAPRRGLYLLLVHTKSRSLRRLRSSVRHKQSLLHVRCFWEYVCLCTVGCSCLGFLCSNWKHIMITENVKHTMRWCGGE